MNSQNKVLTWAGRILSGLVVLMMTFSAVVKFMNPPEVSEQFVGKFGYPEDLTLVIGILELSCVILYAIPQTATLGAVLLTGYLGGAIATHVRVHDNFMGPAIGGIIVWLGVYLRDPRIRGLLPIRRSMTPGDKS